MTGLCLARGTSGRGQQWRAAGSSTSTTLNIALPYYQRSAPSTSNASLISTLAIARAGFWQERAKGWCPRCVLDRLPLAAIRPLLRPVTSAHVVHDCSCPSWSPVTQPPTLFRPALNSFPLLKLTFLPSIKTFTPSTHESHPPYQVVPAQHVRRKQDRCPFGL